MASAPTEDAYSAIKCPICLDTLADPRVLPCGHSLCGPKTVNGCLGKLEDAGEITCPTCRTIHQITAEDVPPVYAFRDILEAMDSRLGKVQMCEVHGKEVTFHCRSDGKDGCIKCVKNHAGHDLEDAVDQELQKLTAFWESEETKLEVKYEACQKRTQMLKRVRDYLDEEIGREDHLESQFKKIIHRRFLISSKIKQNNLDPSDIDFLTLKRLQEDLSDISRYQQKNSREVKEMAALMTTVVENRTSVLSDGIKETSTEDTYPETAEITSDDLHKSSKTSGGNHLSSGLFDRLFNKKAPSCPPLIAAGSSSCTRQPKKVTTILVLAEYYCFHQTLSVGDTEWCEWVEKDLGERYGAVIVGDNIYILGANREGNSEPTSKVIIYKKSLKQWIEGPSMIAPRQSMATCATSKAIYVFGGIKNGEGRGRKTVEKLEIDENGEPKEGWKSTSSMRKKKAYCAAAVLGDRWIFITGGLIDKETVTSSVEIFDTLMEKWHEGPPMNEARYNHATLTYQGQVYVFAGNNSRESDSRINTCEKLNPLENRWEYIATSQRYRSRCGVSLMDNKIYLIGGFGGCEGNEDGHMDVDDYHAVEIYNPLTNSWGKGSNLRVPTYGTNCVSW